MTRKNNNGNTELLKILKDNEALNNMLYLATSDDTLYAAKVLTSDPKNQTAVMDTYEEIRARGLVELSADDTQTVLEAVLRSANPNYTPSNKGTTENIRKFIDELYEDVTNHPDVARIVEDKGSVSQDYANQYLGGETEDEVWESKERLGKICMWQIARSVLIPLITIPMVNGKPLAAPKNMRPVVKEAASSSFKDEEKVEPTTAEESKVDTTDNSSEPPTPKLGTVTMYQEEGEPTQKTISEETKPKTYDVIEAKSKKKSGPNEETSGTDQFINLINQLKAVSNDNRVFDTAIKQTAELGVKELGNCDFSQLLKFNPVYPDGVTPSVVKYCAKTLVISEFAAKHFPAYVDEIHYGKDKLSFDDIAMPILCDRICSDVTPNLIPRVWGKHDEIVEQIKWDNAKATFIVVSMMIDAIADSKTMEFILRELVKMDNLDQIIDDLKDAVSEVKPSLNIRESIKKILFAMFDRYVDSKVDRHVSRAGELLINQANAVADFANKLANLMKDDLVRMGIDPDTGEPFAEEA